MALDGIFLRHIKNEIEKEALGARANVLYAFEKKNRRRKIGGTSPERLRPCSYARL